ncbi:MAG: FHA domain-containing protein [Deltaproteobacteria bacterium]|nr:FHA domain-containing protein [Deltaproteobacteria bacterium]
MGVRLILEPSSRAPREAAASVVDDTHWEYAQARILLGRASSADVVLPHASVSTRHASIEADGVRYAITDHASLNGTWVNGQRVVSERKKPLRDGDRIDVGLFTLRFVANVPVNDVPSRERTAAIAKRLLRAARALEPRAARRLVITNGPDGGRAFELPPPPARVVIGRAETAEVSLSDGDASREHAELIVDAEGVVVRDLGSKNGIFVQEKKVSEARLLDRDELRIGATILAFEDVEGAPSDASLRALESLPDQPISGPSLPPPPPSEPPPAPEPTPVATVPDALTSMAPSEAGALPAATPEPEPPPPTHRASLGAVEWMVYALALLVFGLSAAGLWWLLRGG